MDSRYENVLKDLEGSLGYNFADLKRIGDNIRKKYSRTFGVDLSYLNFEFDNNKKIFYTLTEKCLKRDYDIRIMCGEEKIDEIEDAKILFSIIKSILSFDILYGIDLELVDNIFLSDEEEMYYNYMKFLASTYLEKTAKLKEFILEKNVKNLKKIK